MCRMNKHVSITAVQVTFGFGTWEKLNSYNLINTLKKIFFLNTEITVSPFATVFPKPLNELNANL